MKCKTNKSKSTLPHLSKIKGFDKSRRRVRNGIRQRRGY